MVVFLVLVVLEVMVVMLRQIYLAAYHGLDIREFLRYVAEVLHSVHISVVRDGHTRHSQL